MNNDYHLPDNSPRYGHRTEENAAHPAASLVRVDEAAEAAARLGLDEMAAAIDRRLTSSWADKTDPAMTELRKTHREELAVARKLVRIRLGTQRQWRLKAQAIRDKHLADTMRRRGEAGSALEILFLRLGLMAALITPPSYILATNQEQDLVKFILTGAVCIAAAFIGGHFLTIRARVPVMPDIRGPWLNELREDIIGATLVAILQNKGVDLTPAASEAGRRGWASILAASRAVTALQA